METKRFPVNYIVQETEFCKEELDAFYADPTEENRQKVLDKREKFAVGDYYIDIWNKG